MDDDNNLFERIQLSFSLDNCLKGPTYQVEFFLKDYDKFDTETAKINNQTESSHIDFTKTFNCDYHFSKIQFFTVNVIRRKDRQKMTNFKVIDEDHKITLSSIVACKDSIYSCPIREFAPNSEKLIIKAENPNYLNMKSKNIYTYFDFIKHGIKLKCYIGIDFTQGTDHLLKKEENQYLQAIAGFRETLFSFVRDFKVYGYGAKINETNEKPGFFSLNFDDKKLHGFTEIEKSYKECLTKISFCEEDYLSPLIENIKNLITKNYELNIYNIFFLLISNPPVKEDYQKCIDLFISNTFLPLSVIVVGIGDKEFKEIKHLISKNRKCSSKGIERARNNVYFVSMKDCNYNNEILKNKCLKEIPRQVVEFYKINKTSPDDVKANKLENINKSIEKSINLINVQNNNKVIINNDNNKNNVNPKESNVLKLKENDKQNTNNEINYSQDDSDNNFNLFKDSDKALNDKININNNNNKDIINDNLNKNKIEQNTKHKNKKKERVNEIKSDSDLLNNDFNIISPNDNLTKESNFNFENRTPQNTEDEKNKQITKLENPFCKENKAYRETPYDYPKNEIKKIENPYKKSNNIKKKEDIKDKANEMKEKEKDRLFEFSKEQNERKMPNEKPKIKDREQLQKNLANPYALSRKKEESNRIHHQINDNGNKKKEINYNNFTEKENPERNKPKIMDNPYKKQQYHKYNTEQIKNNNDKNDNNNKNDQKYFNETPNPNPNPSQKYANLKNPYGKAMKADDKKLANETPGNQLNNNIKNYKLMENPFRNRKKLNQNQRNPFKKDSESNQNDINEQKNEIKEEKEKKEKSNNTGNQFSQILKMINKNSSNTPKKINTYEIKETNMEDKFPVKDYNTYDN